MRKNDSQNKKVGLKIKGNIGTHIDEIDETQSTY